MAANDSTIAGHRGELEPPHREAAYFYGLFMRGHSLEELRRDIEVPEHVVSRWQRVWRHEPGSRHAFEEIRDYRRQVLFIFDSLVAMEVSLSHLYQ
ncbi:MAG: hypothetical protein L0Z62_32290 [Gemmataceae bacterium]|nr:hypothetical protein [Gemmataceae bacterium]